MESNEVDANYKEMQRIHRETTPLPNDPPDVQLDVIDPYSDDYIEEKSQIELEVETSKKGIPTFTIERPAIPKVKTDKTRYKKITVNRKEKKSDQLGVMDDLMDFNEDREMKAYVKKLKIPYKISLWKKFKKKVYDLYCKISRFWFNRTRKRIKVEKHIHDHTLSPEVKTKPLATVEETDLKELGRERGFKRKEDRTSNRMQAVRNKKTGVVVMTPSVHEYKGEIEGRGNHNIDDYEVVESQIKDDSFEWSAQDWIDDADRQKELRESLRRINENRKTNNRQQISQSERG